MNLASCRFEFESWNLNTLTLIIILVSLKSSIVTKTSFNLVPLEMTISPF